VKPGLLQNYPVKELRRIKPCAYGIHYKIPSFQSLLIFKIITQIRFPKLHEFWVIIATSFKTKALTTEI
jgi:hypothetical protein